MTTQARTGEVAVAGGRLQYSIHGRTDAPWLTLLHSLATDRRLWTPQIDALAPDYRLLCIDLRGHGQSQADDRPTLMSDLADDVVAVWDALGVDRSHVVGLSIGGMTALGLTLDRPDRVGRVVAADCRADAPAFFRDMWTGRRGLVREGGLAAIADATLGSWLTADTRAERPDLVREVRQMIETTSVAGYMAATHALMHLDHKRRLEEMTRPVLFLCGAEDGPHPAEMRVMAGLTPDAVFEEIPAASHLSNLEQPAIFNAAVLRWLG